MRDSGHCLSSRLQRRPTMHILRLLPCGVERIRPGKVEIRSRTKFAKYCNSQIYFLSAFLVDSVFAGSDFGLSSFFFADESPFADEPDDASAEVPEDFRA